MAGREGEKSVVVSSVVLASWLDEVPVSRVDSSEWVAANWSSVASQGGGGVASGVGGVVGGLVESFHVKGISLSLSLGLSISLSLSVEVPVSEVVVRRLVEAPGVSGVDSGVTVGVGEVVEESLASVGVVEHLRFSLSLSLWFGLSFSLGDVDGSDRVSQISAAGSVAVGLVGSNGDGGGESSHSVVVVGGVAGVAGVAVGVEVALLVAEGAVEQLGVGLSLSSSQSSATDLRGKE